MAGTDHERNVRLLREAGIGLVDALTVANDVELWAQWADLCQRALATGKARLAAAAERGEDGAPGPNDTG